LKIRDSRLEGDDVDFARVLDELDSAVDECEDGEVASNAGVFAGEVLGSALADDDASCGDLLAAVCLHATVLRIAVASVAAGGLAFFMCHD